MDNGLKNTSRPTKSLMILIIYKLSPHLMLIEMVSF